ncbi:hypothetical protein KSF78_0004845 [Schistosoma japonicum]|nr:hypothetical protein KSF78_0004845 [Schistosoma japonicum]
MDIQQQCAQTIQKAWSSYQDRQIFKIFKSCLKILENLPKIHLLKILLPENYETLVNKCIVKAIGRRKYFDRVFGDSCIYFQPHFMNERCISDVITTRKLFIEELPAAYGGHQNHWRHLDGKGKFYGYLR